MEELKKIAWARNALLQFNDIYNYISDNSPQNAEKVRLDILKQVEKAAKYPEMFPADYYKLNNKGNYRYFEIHRVRVSYKIFENVILIVRLRHTSRKPKTF